jgi:ribonuclease D
VQARNPADGRKASPSQRKNLAKNQCDFQAQILEEMTPEEIQQLPLARFTGNIHLVRNAADWESVCSLLPTEGVIGFDTESRPSFRKGQWYPPSLVQLATDTDAILVQISRMEDPYSILGSVLENESLLKVGVAIRDDVRFLQRVFPFEPRGFVEVDSMAKKAELPYTGLRRLAACLLSIRLSKGAQVSDWSKPQLTESQIHYAAADAWISRRVYLVLREQHSVDPTFCECSNVKAEKPRRRRRPNRRRQRKPEGETEESSEA